MNIRVYDTKDQEEVISLWRGCGLVAPQNDPIKDIERKLKVNPELFLVGVDDGHLIATVMAGYEGHRGWINYLAVEPKCQGKGHGRKIMKAVEQLLRQRGCPKINLQVRSKNTAVIDFYTAIGYGDDEVISLGKRLQQD